MVFIKILAIDQARNGAWAIFNYDTKELETYGTFSFGNKKYTYAKAILAIETLVDELIKEHDISAVFIEDIQLRVNVQSFKKLAQLQGVLVNLFEKNEYLYSFVAPTQWQNYCKARGRTSKEVKEKFHIDTDNDNLSDAICIGHYAVNHFEIEGKTLHVKEKQ